MSDRERRPVYEPLTVARLGALMADSDESRRWRAAIQDAFRRLGERLARRGIVADIYVIGGAAMTLAYC